MEQLTTRRRRAWISAISRSDLTDDKLEHERVCYRHFVSGQAAKQWEQFDVDWVPTLHLGHTKRPQRFLLKVLREHSFFRRGGGPEESL